MNKLLLIVSMAILCTSCSPTKRDDTCAQLQQTIDSLQQVLAAIHMPVNSDSTTCQNNLLDTIVANNSLNRWGLYLDSILPPRLSLPTQAFVISANDLYHAITDSEGIASVVFYIGLDEGKSPNMSLIYAPARSVPLNNQYDSLTIVPNIDSSFVQPPNHDTVVMAKLYDNSVPCPYCVVQGPVTMGGGHFRTFNRSFRQQRSTK